MADVREEKLNYRWWLLPVVAAVLGLFIATAAARWGFQDDVEKQVLVERAKLEGIRAGDADAAGLREAAENRIAQLKEESNAFGYFSRFDAARYEEIVSKGYVYHQWNDPAEVKDAPNIGPRLKNVVWYPLYPVIGIVIQKVTGISTAVALNVVSLVCLLFGAPMFFLMARRHFASRTGDGPSGDSRPADSAALGATVLLLMGPCSYFLYANFTESLFVLLLAAFLYCLQSRNWWAAAAIAAVASSSRSQGVLFGPVLALSFLVRSELPMRPRFLWAVLLGAISGIGLLCWMIYQQMTWGDALAFMHAQSTWHVGINGETLNNAIRPVRAFENLWAMMFPPPGYIRNWPGIWEASCVIWPPVVLIAGRRFLTMEQAVIGWLLWGLPYISNGVTGLAPDTIQWMSMGRFMSVALPLYLIAGAAFMRFRWLMPVMLGAAGGAFALFAYKAGGNWWIG